MDFDSVFANAVDPSVTDPKRHGFQIRRPHKRTRVSEHPEVCKTLLNLYRPQSQNQHCQKSAREPTCTSKFIDIRQDKNS